MSLHQLFTPRAITPFLVALLLVVIAVGWERGTGTISASTTGGSAEQGGSCPLTSTQQVKSIKAWMKMMPVFRHPRCLNCHGGIPQPLVNKGDPPKRHAGVVDIVSGMTLGVCEDCHMVGWETPHPIFHWTDKTDMELCSFQKSKFSAAKFVDHIRRDLGGTQFIAAAFVGKRSLDIAAQAIYEGETGLTFKAEPPPGTHAQLTQQAQDWVDAQGGSFVGDADCGCVLDKMEVNFHSTLTIANHGPAKETSTITGEGSIVLKLGPDPEKPEWDATVGPEAKTANMTWSGVTVTQPAVCVTEIKPSPSSQAEYWLGVSYKPDLKFSLEFVPLYEMHFRITRCTHPVLGVVVHSDSIPHIFAAAWTMLHGGPDAQAMAGLAMPKPGAAPTAPAGGLDMSKIMSMDPKALEAMAEAMKANPTPANMAQLGKLMNQVVPGADKMAADAKRNFTFAIPDNPKTNTTWCKLGTRPASLADCYINRTITVPDNKGSTQTITERTIITIGRPKP